MIIDRVLDRYDGAAYDPKSFYHYCNGLSYYGDKIAAAMDYGTELTLERLLLNILAESIIP